MKKPQHLLLIFPFLLFGFFLNAQNGESLFDFISNLSEEIPVITLKTDSKQLIRKKLAEEYQDAHLSFSDGKGGMIETVAEVRSRGNIRKEVCYFPPLKIKVKKKRLKTMGFDTINKLKLVLQCKSGKTGEAYLLKENLIYKLHQPIGPISYRTKLIKIRLVRDEDKVEELFAFLIEEEDNFAKRLDGAVVEFGRIPDRLVDRDSYLKMVFFQYMILNTDWYEYNKHNLEFIRPEGSDKFVIVPYDFDYSGMVGTSYSMPHPSRGISSVTEPCFLGKKVSLEEAKQTISYFLSKKEELYKIANAYSHLESKQKAMIISYLDDFFETIGDDRRISRNFVTLDD